VAEKGISQRLAGCGKGPKSLGFQKKQVSAALKRRPDTKLTFAAAAVGTGSHLPPQTQFSAD
jgi:hypothetical protein